MSLAPELAVVAVVLKPLPDTVDLPYAVLTAAGFGSLLGSSVGTARGVSDPERAVFAERLSLLFAAAGMGIFTAVALIQAVL